MITSSPPSATSTTPAISRETRSASLRQRSQLRVLVGEQPAIGPGAQGDEARACRHLRVRFPFRVASTVEAHGRSHHPRKQAEADGSRLIEQVAKRS
jgi:hypothetical protein